MYKKKGSSYEKPKGFFLKNLPTINWHYALWIQEADCEVRPSGVASFLDSYSNTWSSHSTIQHA